MGLASSPRTGSVTRAGCGHPLGQQCPSFLQRVLLPCQPWGLCPAPTAQQPSPARSSPATHSGAQRQDDGRAHDADPSHPPCRCLKLLQHPRVAIRSPPTILGRTQGQAACVCPHCPFCLPSTGSAGGPGLAPAHQQAGSTGHLSSLPWDSTPCGEVDWGQPWPHSRAQKQGHTQVAADCLLSLWPPILPVLYATCYRL